VGAILMIVGLALAGVGALIWMGVPLGRLPGDVVLRRGGTTVYLPITTSLLASVVLSLVVWLFRR
jgi:membrane protein implicated in regulation of membrane protease activity